MTTNATTAPQTSGGIVRTCTNVHFAPWRSGLGAFFFLTGRFLGGGLRPPRPWGRRAGLRRDWDGVRRRVVVANPVASYAGERVTNLTTVNNNHTNFRKE